MLQISKWSRINLPLAHRRFLQPDNLPPRYCVAALEELQKEGDLFIAVAGRHFLPRSPKGIEDGVDLAPVAPGGLIFFKLDDDPAGIFGVAYPAYQPRLLQPVE